MSDDACVCCACVGPTAVPPLGGASGPGMKSVRGERGPAGPATGRQVGEGSAKDGGDETAGRSVSCEPPTKSSAGADEAPHGSR